MSKSLQSEYQATVVRPIYLTCCLLAVLCIIIIGYSVLDFPIYQTALGIGLSLCSILLWRFPSAWLFVIPMLIPVLDLTPVSGRVFYNEFDLFILLTFAVSMLRQERWLAPLGFSRLSWLLILLLCAWQFYTTVLGVLPLPRIDHNSFTSFYSDFNGLRIVKGFIYALLLLPSLGQAIYRKDPVAPLFCLGMLASLAIGVAVILWERALFTGILNFSTPYRVTGLFSMMATGGAPIDAHLIMTIPFIYFLFCQRQAAYIAIGSGLLLTALYSVAVTYSRTNYPALLFSAMTITCLWLYQHKAQFKTIKAPQRRSVVAVCTIILLLVIPVFSGQYIQDRFSTVKEDFQGRINHWQWSTQIMHNNTTSQLFGMGKGSFPRTYFWQQPDAQLPSIISHQYDQNDDNSVINMGASHASGDLFLRQRITVGENKKYRLSIDLKPKNNQETRLLIEFCERIIFQAYRECKWIGINSHANSEQWQTFNRQLNLSSLGKSYLIGSRPVEISILNRGMKEGILIDNVKIISPDGNNLLKNSNFEYGLDNWFLYSGDHLAWHIKNTWFDAYFEGGILGLAILCLLLAALFIKALQRTKQQDQLVIPLASAFTGLLIVGLFDSLFDDPRIGLMFFLLCWMMLSRRNHLTQA